MATKDPQTLRQAWLVVALVLLATVLLYLRVLHGELMFDDTGAIATSNEIRDLPGRIRAFIAPRHNERPLTDLSFALNYAAGRLDPWGYHATNLAIHLVAVLLAFVFTRRVFALAEADEGSLTAAVVAGLFALHPIQSQAVSYVTQRAESLSSAFYLATMVSFLEAEEAKGRRHLLAYLASLLCFGLGMATKDVCATMPVAYILLIATVASPARSRERMSWRRRIVYLLPFLPLLLLRIWAILPGTFHVAGDSRGSPTGQWSAGTTPGNYFMSQWRVLVDYLALLFWPARQCVDWDFSLSRGLDWQTARAGLLLLALFTGAALLLWRFHSEDRAVGGRTRVAAFGVLWFFLVLAPTSSVVPLADFKVEHRLYLPTWGISVSVTLLASSLLAKYLPKRRSAVAMAMVAAVWTLLGATLYRRNAVWKDQITMWRDVVVKAPNKVRAHALLGDAYLAAGNLDAAVPELQIALEAYSRAGMSLKEQETRISLGSALVDSGRVAAGVDVLEGALSQDPTNATVMASLAAAYLRKGDLDRAESLAAKAIAKNGAEQSALFVMGELQLARRNYSKAAEVLTEAVRLAPDEPLRALELATALAALGRTGDACRIWRQVETLATALPADRAEAIQLSRTRGCPAE